MTSNVDPVNESLIQDAITELAKNRTVLVVAHHLKTIQKADQILVFQKGNLLEKGKHGELLAKMVTTQNYGKLSMRYNHDFAKNVYYEWEDGRTALKMSILKLEKVNLF